MTFVSSYGMNCIPPKLHEVLTPVPLSVTFFGNRVMVDVVKMRSYYSSTLPIPHDCCPNAKAVMGRQTHRTW
jgi:hypothetical protein